MAFRHGVYTSEIATAIQAAPAVDSALPYVIGASKVGFEPVLVSSWSQFVEISGITEGSDDLPGDDGWHELSLVSFAYLWFKVFGRGDCILRGIASVDGSVSLAAVTSAIGEVDTVYERVRRVPSLLLVPYFGGVPAVWTLLKNKAELFGGRFKALAVSDIQCSEHALSGTTPTVISAPSAVAAAKTVSSAFLTLYWPYIGVGDMRFDMSSAAVAVMNRIDGLNGGLPYVSPSNKECSATGVYTMPVGTLSEHIEGCKKQIIGSLYYVADAGGNKVTFGFDIDGATARIPGYPSVTVVLTNTGGTKYWEITANHSSLPSSFEFVVDYPGVVEAPLYLSREEVNSALGANGVAGALNTSGGWMLWGNNTTAFPTNLDPKDNLIACRRMFNHVSNAFQIFADGRIDLPINARQLEGVIKAFNQVLSGWVGNGALNAASVELDSERNTTASLLSGAVYIRIKIAPPPPMSVIEGVIEYDVEGFEASLA